jgi:exosortase/archaeosortase family protein
MKDERTRFALAFAAIAGCLLILYYLPRHDNDRVERWMAEYLRLYARLVGFVVRIFDPNVTVYGNTVAGRFSMQIVKSCDAMEANILFASAILAFPVPWRRKAAALGGGLAALVTLNLFRLVTLYFVGIFAGSAFESMHRDVWPLLMVAFAAVDFCVCIRLASGPQVRTLATWNVPRQA